MFGISLSQILSVSRRGLLMSPCTSKDISSSSFLPEWFQMAFSFNLPFFPRFSRKNFLANCIGCLSCDTRRNSKLKTIGQCHHTILP